MGCISSNPIIKIKSIETFKKKIKKNIKQNESEDLADKILNFSGLIIGNSNTSNNSEGKQSQILIEVKIENNELIFL